MVKIIKGCSVREIKDVLTFLGAIFKDEITLKELIKAYGSGK